MKEKILTFMFWFTICMLSIWFIIPMLTNTYWEINTTYFKNNIIQSCLAIILSLLLTIKTKQNEN